MMGAVKFPLKSGDWAAVRPGKCVFLHKSIPKGWWEEYDVLAQGQFRPLLFMAVSSMTIYTWTEARRLLQPIGGDSWIYDLLFKYGMRDGLGCPAGGRWALAFWSNKEISNIVTPSLRVMLSSATIYAASRMDQLVPPNPDSLGRHIILTPRELAVLRMASLGKTFQEIAKTMQLGEETIRTHIKKAEAKLDARNRTHAVAEALRNRLIP
jgi:DNA-binding CsgD family transcriptional regulator